MSKPEPVPEHEDLYRLIIDALPEGVVLQMADGRLSVANDSAQRILGLDFGEIAAIASGAQPARVIGADGRVLLPHAWPTTRALSGGRSVRDVTMGIYRPDNSLVWVSANASPLFRAGEAKPCAVVWSFVARQNVDRNVTDLYGAAEPYPASRLLDSRREAEESIRALNAELEEKVRERTRDLEATVQELEAFSYSVSHDLRAPLRSIEGFTGIIERQHSDGLDEKGRHFLERVRRASTRMGELIDDLLALSQVTRGEFAVTDVDLSEITCLVAQELTELDPERSISLSVAPEIVVRGDPRLLRTVMENLLGNAWKFTARRDRAVIEVGVMPTDHGRAVFVRDNGAGFDMLYVDKMFNSFQRLHSRIEFPGTGIGLAIVKRVINRHGGRVWAEGLAGVGATVYFVV